MPDSGAAIQTTSTAIAWQTAISAPPDLPVTRLAART